MNKINLASGLSAIVLLSGLVSCSPEKPKEVDAFKVSAPNIRRSEGGSVDWKAFTALEKRELAIGDVIETQNPNVALKGRTTCRIIDRDMSFDWQEAPTKEIPLFRLLPREVLSTPLDKSEVNCSLEFSFYNGIGSRHIFNWPLARIRDAKEFGVRIELGTPEIQNEIPVLNAGQKELVKIRFASASPLRTELVCRDLSFPSIPLDQVVEFDRFDIQNPQLASGKTPDDIQRKPVQPCRIYIEDRGRKISLSSLFYVRMPSAGLTVTTEQPYSNPPTTQYETGSNAVVGTYFMSGMTNLMAIRIQNDHAHPRIFKLVGKTWPIDAKFYHQNPNMSYNQSRGAILNVTQSTGAEIQETPEGRTFILQPKGFVVMNQIDNAMHRYLVIPCGNSSTLRLTHIRQLAPMRFEFLSEDGLLASVHGHVMSDAYIGSASMFQKGKIVEGSFPSLPNCGRGSR